MHITEKLQSSFEKIKETVPKVKFIEEYQPDGEFSGIDAITYESVPYNNMRTKIFAYLGIPKATNGEKLPAVVLIHGGGGHAYACWVKMWNDRGYAAIAMDTTGYMPSKKNAGSREGAEDSDCWTHALTGVFVEEGFVPSPLNDRMRTTDQPMENQWMYHALASVILAGNILRINPCVDSDKIGVTGISWGGVICSLLIGYDQRFAFAVPVYGSGFLGDGLSDLNKILSRPEVNDNWCAERNFDKVNFPVLWLAWNDDDCFSIQPNSLSYSKTALNHSNTRLSIQNQMYHSHEHGWNPGESYMFADAQIHGGAEFPKITVQPHGRRFSFPVECGRGVRITRATGYYICEPMVYSKFDKYGFGEYSFMKQYWQSLNCDIQDNNLISGVFPDNCVSYYIEIAFSIKEQELVISTVFVDLQ